MVFIFAVLQRSDDLPGAPTQSAPQPAFACTHERETPHFIEIQHIVGWHRTGRLRQGWQCARLFWANHWQCSGPHRTCASGHAAGCVPDKHAESSRVAPPYSDWSTPQRGDNGSRHDTSSAGGCLRYSRFSRVGRFGSKDNAVLF